MCEPTTVEKVDDLFVGAAMFHFRSQSLRSIDFRWSCVKPRPHARWTCTRIRPLYTFCVAWLLQF